MKTGLMIHHVAAPPANIFPSSPAPFLGPSTLFPLSLPSHPPLPFPPHPSFSDSSSLHHIFMSSFPLPFTPPSCPLHLPSYIFTLPPILPLLHHSALYPLLRAGPIIYPFPHCKSSLELIITHFPPLPFTLLSPYLPPTLLLPVYSLLHLHLLLFYLLLPSSSIKHCGILGTTVT